MAGYAAEYASALWSMRRLARWLARERPFDVVHACSPPDFLLLSMLSLRRQGARFIFDHHDLTPELFETRFGSAGGVVPASRCWPSRSPTGSPAVIMSVKAFRR